MDKELNEELRDLPHLQRLQGGGDGFRLPPGLLDELVRQTVEEGPPSTSRRRRLLAIRYWTVAAALLLLLGVAWWLWQAETRSAAAVALVELPAEDIYTYLSVHVDELELETLSSALPQAPEAPPLLPDEMLDAADDAWLESWLEEPLLY